MTKKELENSVMKNGEPQLLEPWLRFQDNCCDCGLSHLVVISPGKGKTLIKRSYRDDYHTQEVRKAMNINDLKWLRKQITKEINRRKMKK